MPLLLSSIPNIFFIPKKSSTVDNIPRNPEIGLVILYADFENKVNSPKIDANKLGNFTVTTVVIIVFNDFLFSLFITNNIIDNTNIDNIGSIVNLIISSIWFIV